MNFSKSLSKAKSLFLEEKHSEAFDIIRNLALINNDFVAQLKLTKLLLSIDSNLLNLKPIKIAILASTTIDSFSDILKFHLALEGFNADIWISDYNTIVSTVLDEGSDLYTFDPEIVWIFTTYRDVQIDSNLNDSKSSSTAIKGALSLNTTLWKTIQSKLSCIIVHNNADIPSGDIFGNYAGQISWSKRNLLRLYNLKLESTLLSGVTIFDFDNIASNFGYKRWIDLRYWYHSKHAFAFDAYSLVAFRFSKLVSGIKGKAKKCLILDLDNTLWGGIIGDDGISGIKLGNGADGEAFIDFQKYILSLKQRGIILAVCSKNEEINAKEPFMRHPDMQIKLEDIAVFKSNWQNKADNIKNIATILNIGMESLVFVDDNPAERNLVRQFLPMVAVPELSSDPSEYVQIIEKQHYFETIDLTSEDFERASYYRDNAIRNEVSMEFNDISEYLKSLQMVSEKGNLDSFHLPRISQLINKSNQFHLTGKRYSESQLKSYAIKQNWQIRYFKLQDKFGDNGLVSAVVLDGEDREKLVIDTWVMSCRVLSRSMEEFVLNDIIDIANLKGYGFIFGRYIPSEKNKLVSLLYERLGFSQVSDENGITTWILKIPYKKNIKTWVRPSSSNSS